MRKTKCLRNSDELKTISQIKRKLEFVVKIWSSAESKRLLSELKSVGGMLRQLESDILLKQMLPQLRKSILDGSTQRAQANSSASKWVEDFVKLIKNGDQ